MGCCIALALVIGLARMAWFRLTRRQPPGRAGFAPPARRAAPDGSTGTATPTPGGRPEPAPPAPGDARRSVDARRARRSVRPAAVPVLAALVGAGLYAELLSLLAWTGAVAAATGPREPVLIGAGLAAAALAVMFRVNRRHLALVLVGGGASWSLLSVLDMHLTGVVSAHHHHGNALADVALHGPGFLAVVLGVAGMLTAQPLITNRGIR
ncbi:hypothetical protein GCM10023321_53100 [Pseudonocardia eucalypti]|uniref:Uncharacterized protein n=1 Tax=Pseudonocardia eucalypti TaxID=648755 RepID=A0ABP9QMU9_9PSEU|nr:hypothetical protein [Pseudonocardia eucalypti]